MEIVQKTAGIVITSAAALLIGSAGLVGFAQTHTMPPATADAQHDHTHDAAEPAGMTTMHQMMEDMQAADARLQALVTAMNAAKGDAQVAAIAQAVTELAAQQRALHAHMSDMHAHMMPMMMGRGGMMKP